MPIATLYQIPNQPIWDQKEDALIAVTLQKWFETKDDSWPLLFPMAKSAYEAMNAIEKSTAKSSNPIKKFVVTGASKRGWTTWLVAGTGDKRIIGIAPVVFDNLNIVAQMKHQKDLWGHYSPQIQDYEKSGMLAALETPDGKRIAAMMDPLTYADRIKCPLFSINGTNDPFWAPDAMSLYWDKLKMPKSCLFLPNEGHTFKYQNPYVDSLGAFASSCSGEFKWPTMNSKIAVNNAVIRGQYRIDGLERRWSGLNSGRQPKFPGMFLSEDILMNPGHGAWKQTNVARNIEFGAGFEVGTFVSKVRHHFTTGAIIVTSIRIGRHWVTVSSLPKLLASN